MYNITNFALKSLALCAALFIAANAAGADGISRKASTGAPVDVKADSFSASSNGWIEASGNVLIRHSDAQITADRIKVNKDTGEMVAEGNVILVRDGQIATRTERLSYNYKTGEGIAPKLDVQSGVLRIISGRSRRLPDETFELDDVIVTTCTNDPSCLHYAVHGNHALYNPDQYIILRNETLRLGGVPVFFFPIWKRSFNDHFGWRFLPGYESDWGGYLLSTYQRQLFDFGGEFHDSLDSHTHLDYRSERGFALGEDLLWHFGAPSAGHKGFISVYGLSDDKPMDERFDRISGYDIVDKNRYRVMLRHDSNFGEQDALTVRTSYLSDSYLLHDFYEDEYNDLVQPDSFASYTHTGNGWSAGLGVYHRMNDFYESVNRLPELWLDVLRTRVGSSALFYESQTLGGVLQHEYADYDNTNAVNEAYDTLRIDTRHALFLPFNVSRFLSIVPRAVYRGTYYGDTFENRTVGRLDGTNTVFETFSFDNGAKLRNIFELGAEASFKMYGIFDTDAGRVRHVVEPYMNYTYIPEPNVSPDEVHHFDSVDTLNKNHSAKIGVRQNLQRKIDDKTMDLIYADIYGIYEFENVDGDSEFSTFGIDSDFRPTSSIHVELEGEYDVSESEIDYINIWANLWNGERWEAAGACYYRPDESTLFKGEVVIALSEYWTVDIYTRYDSQISRLEELGGYIQYNLDCLSMRFKTAYQPAFTRDDGTERESKFKIGFYMWLRAYAPSRYEKRLRDSTL